MPKAKSYSGSASSKKAAKPGSSKRPTNGPVPPYGVPIRDAIARGRLNEMRKLATTTRKWLRDVESALKKLESSIAKLEK